MFNTVADNDSKGGSTRVGGIKCSAAGGLLMLVSRNIISDNGGGDTLGGDCSGYLTNYIGTVSPAAKFAPGGDYKLTMMSPGTILRDDLESLPDCMFGSPPKYIDDFEGQTRPAGFCDRGADEFKPLTASSLAFQLLGLRSARCASPCLIALAGCGVTDFDIDAAGDRAARAGLAAARPARGAVPAAARHRHQLEDQRDGDRPDR